MDRPIYFRIMRELRRSAYYVLAAAPLLAVTAFFVSRFARHDGTTIAILTGGFFLLLCLTMVVPLRWSVRIDDQGVARRLLWRWDIWTWADISSGRIEKRDAYALSDPERPWWRRSFELGYMAPKDIAQAIKLVNAHYRLPAAAPLPDNLKIRFGNFLCRSARFDAKGVRLRGIKETREYPWSEVRRLHIVRMDPLRRDFRSLEMTLPDQDLEWRKSAAWCGATPEVLCGVLERCVPADRIDEDVVGEPFAKRIDIEKQLASVRSQHRGYRYGLRVVFLLLGVCLLWMAFTRSASGAAIMAGMAALLNLPMCYLAEKQFRSQCQELEQHWAEKP